MNINYKKILEKKDYLPFYVYDYEVIKGQILKLKRHLPSNVKVYYSVKANPNIAILKIMKNFGLGVEVASEGEFLAAQKAGFSAKNIIVGGARKTDNDLEFFIKSNVGLISLQSITEVARLNDIAKNFRRRQRIILRLYLSPFRKNREEKVAHSGFSLPKFGKIINDFPKKFSNLELEGIHVYELNRIFDRNILLREFKRIFTIARDFERKFNLRFKVLDIGGGIGTNFVPESSGYDFAKSLTALIDRYQFCDKNKIIVLESGRYLVNNSGSFVSRIIDVKEENYRGILAVEGIINHLLRIFKRKENSRFRENSFDYRVYVLPVRKRAAFAEFNICGQTVSVADTFGRSFACPFRLKRPRAGDFLVIWPVGAYGLTMSLGLFGSRPVAAEFLLVNNKLELIRDKGKPEDFLLRQRIPFSLLNKKI